MANNGFAPRGAVLAPSGDRAPVTTNYEAPGPQSPFFGWMGEEGFSTIKIDQIQALCPNPQRRDQYIVSLHGINLIINILDAERLMKRMGWAVPKGV